MSYDFNVNIKLVMPTGWETESAEAIEDETTLLEDPYFEISLLDEEGQPVEGYSDQVRQAWKFKYPGGLVEESKRPIVEIDLAAMQRFDIPKEEVIKNMIDNILDLKAEVPAEEAPAEEAPAE